MNNIDLQREIAQLQVTIQGLGAENVELRRKLAEQQAQMLIMAEYLASADSCYSLDGHSLEFNTEELTAQLSAAKQEGYEQAVFTEVLEKADEIYQRGKQAGRDEKQQELSEWPSLGEKSENGIEWRFCETVRDIPIGAKLIIRPSVPATKKEGE